MAYSNRKRWLLIVPLLLVGGLVFAEIGGWISPFASIRDALSPSHKELALFLGKEARVMTTPDRLKIFQIEPDWPNWPDKPVKLQYADRPRVLGRFPIIAEGPVLVKKEMENWNRKFLLAGTYLSDDKWCGQVMPGFALEFVKGKDSVWVMICFKCSELLVIKSDGREITLAFDPVADDLAEFLQKRTGKVIKRGIK